MRNVTIRRCPTCSNIGSRVDELKTALGNDQDLNVTVVDGNKGEFTVDVDGRRIKGANGSMLRSADEIAADVRGAQVASAG